MTALRYRPDIEGLRALAVLLVIVYHFEFPGISGGFIGVDVFFVISGFVITGLLTRQMDQGGFRFGDFYARRIRRLVPAFLLVSTVTFLIISPFYIGDDYYIFAKSWLASLMGISNLYYFTELSQYFAPETRSLSLLHTWSLAVEEQFYLLWPAATLWAWRSGRLTRSPLVFLALLIAALLLSVYLAHTHPKAALYLPPARLFEFMLGAGVALYGHRLPALGPRQAEALAVAGVGDDPRHRRIPDQQRSLSRLQRPVADAGHGHGDPGRAGAVGHGHRPPAQPAGDGVPGRALLLLVPVALAAGGAVALPADRADLADSSGPAGGGTAGVLAGLQAGGKPAAAPPLEFQAGLQNSGVGAAADHLGDPVHHPHRRRPQFPHPRGTPRPLQDHRAERQRRRARAVLQRPHPGFRARPSLPVRPAAGRG
ncbi:MAG TPA: hypothetical protein DD399_17325 [Alcanivorax sp.]|nr:hypothetical protein [Alcanivorax sp.]